VCVCVSRTWRKRASERARHTEIGREERWRLDESGKKIFTRTQKELVSLRCGARTCSSGLGVNRFRGVHDVKHRSNHEKERR
jgi:hypothetical protein